MNTITRRSLFRGAAAYPALFNIVRAAKPTDIRIEDVRYTYEDYIYRTPIKFGGSVLDRATIINVDCTVRTAGGKVSKGFGSMPMGNVWSFPSKTLSYDTTLGAMKALADRISRITVGYKDTKPRMPLYHLVGAVDPITDADVKKRVGDGLPETLPEWIRFNGLTNLKIKLNGDQVEWDIDRVLTVDRVTEETQKQRHVAKWVYSLDFNEKCPNVDYLIDFLRRVKEKAPACFDRIQYVEQPTARDLKSHRDQDMHKASALKPVVIDESLTDIENLMLSREMGYTGAALKACKQQSQAMLMAAIGQKHKMFLCVQDLTCPGASLIHSASIAARVPTVAAIEANSRQYCPVANKGWDERFPGIFKITDGTMNTSVLDKQGLGVV